jgi:hypothetical protein
VNQKEKEKEKEEQRFHAKPLSRKENTTRMSRQAAKYFSVAPLRFLCALA